MVTLLGMRRFWFSFFVFIFFPTADNHFVAVIVVFYGKAVRVLFDEFFIDWFPSKRFLTWNPNFLLLFIASLIARWQTFYHPSLMLVVPNLS